MFGRRSRRESLDRLLQEAAPRNVWQLVAMPAAERAETLAQAAALLGACATEAELHSSGQFSLGVSASRSELGMEPYFRPYKPDQQLLLPPSLRDWLPDGHLVYFVSDTVDQLDLSEILSRYRGFGQGKVVAYQPALMLKLLIYGYATGVFSSRRIAGAYKVGHHVRVLAAGECFRVAPET